MDDFSPYAESLKECGDAFIQLSETKDAMELNVGQNFLEPLSQLSLKDIKEIMHHRKKLESRRLDYDYKKSKGAKVPEEELNVAAEKFEESKDLCYSSMMNLMESDVEHIGSLHAFAEAVRDYHKQCSEIMDNLVDALSSKMNDATSRPRQERTSISRPIRDSDSHSANSYDLSPDPVHGGSSSSLPPQPINNSFTPNNDNAPKCVAQFEFQAENEGELSFAEGDVIMLTSQIDENWFEGTLNGKSGFFPINYVRVVNPL